MSKFFSFQHSKHLYNYNIFKCFAIFIQIQYIIYIQKANYSSSSNPSIKFHNANFLALELCFMFIQLSLCLKKCWCLGVFWWESTFWHHLDRDSDWLLEVKEEFIASKGKWMSEWESRGNTQSVSLTLVSLSLHSRTANG